MLKEIDKDIFSLVSDESSKTVPSSKKVNDADPIILVDDMKIVHQSIKDFDQLLKKSVYTLTNASKSPSQENSTKQNGLKQSYAFSSLSEPVSPKANATRTFKSARTLLSTKPPLNFDSTDFFQERIKKWLFWITSFMARY